MLRKLFALTEQGAKDLKKGIIASVFTSLSLMMPMGLLLMLVMQLLQPLLGMETATPSLGAYAGMCLVLLVIIFLTHYIQYRCTYIAAYAESAQRRIGLPKAGQGKDFLHNSGAGQRDTNHLQKTGRQTGQRMGQCMGPQNPHVGKPPAAGVHCIILIHLPLNIFGEKLRVEGNPAHGQADGCGQIPHQPRTGGHGDPSETDCKHIEKGTGKEEWRDGYAHDAHKNQKQVRPFPPAPVAQASYQKNTDRFNDCRYQYNAQCDAHCAGHLTQNRASVDQ